LSIVPAATPTPTPASPAPGPSRRYLTLLFSDLSHSTRLGTLLEAEPYAELIERLHGLATEIVARHGGIVARIQGDGMLAVFGHPQSSEDDVRRAAEAALELHAAVRALPTDPALPAELRQLTLHSGLHSGLVLVGEGDVMRGRLELTGHAPNVAARLAQEAQADEILASESSLGPERPLFVTVARRQIVPRGTEQPIAVCGIAGRAGVLRRFEALKLHGLSPFVGRTRERERLRGLLAGLHGDSGPARGALVAIGGGVGLGKTRLAEEFMREAEAIGCRVHRGWCASEPVAEPMQPWLQMLRALPGETTSTLATAASVPALVERFAALCRESPQLLFVDDWQWADDASHHALQALAALGTQAPLIVLLTQRGAPGSGASLAGSAPAQLVLIELQALDEGDARLAVEHLLPGVSPFLRDAIAAQAGGNPLFVEELCHAATAVGTGMGVADSAGAASASAWLDSLIASRVARLPAEQAALVRCAAVLGHTVPDWLFERVSGVGLRAAELQALADEDLLYPDVERHRLVFKHRVARDAIYRAVGLAERSRWHQLAAGALHEAALSHGTPPGPGDEHVEALAWHYAAAGLPAAAAQMAERAGDKALAASALDRAKAHFRAALAALDKLEPAPSVHERWVAIAQRLGLACVFDADTADLPSFRRGVDLARGLGDPKAEARMRYWLAYVAYGVGDLRTAIGQGLRALELARAAGDDRLAVQLAATLGQAYAAATQYERALPLLDAAIAVKRQHRSGSGLAVGLNYTLAVKATLLADRGEVEAADTLFAEALAPVRGLNHQVEASILGLHAATLLWQGRDAEALACGEQCWRIGERVRSLFTCAMGRSAASFARWRLNPADTTALEAVAESTRWLTERGVHLFGSLNQGWLAEMQAATGDRDAARRAAVAALQCARRGDWMGVGMAGRAMARLHAAAGNTSRASFWLRQAERAALARAAPAERLLNQRLRERMA
jgi:class 3 adenylate cyclase/tetratricopeptide (TPR) repeat protein